MKTTFTRWLLTVAAAVGSVAVLAPMASGQTGFRGHPDAIDRAVAARQAELRETALEARERGLVERPAVTLVGPDALERALISHTDEMTTRTAAMLDARERALTGRPVSSVERPSSLPGFGWSEFGIGAGAGIGAALLLALAGIALVGSRRGERVKTA
jgi:hypothetical protein